MPSIISHDDEQDIYLVEDDRGASGSVWCEAPVTGSDFEAIVFFEGIGREEKQVPSC